MLRSLVGSEMCIRDRNNSYTNTGCMHMSESSNERFNEPWHLPTHFLATVCVRCPKCSGKATVKGNSKYLSPWRPVSSSLVCAECSFTATSEEKQWHGAISGYGSRACGHCGYKWVKFEKHYSNPPKNIPTNKDCSCEQCGKSSNVEIGWQKDVFWGEAQDPYFGLDLYMQGTIDQNIFGVTTQSTPVT